MIYIYDIEVYPNFFCVTFLFEHELYTFEISSRKNDIKKLQNFIKNVKGLVGFNNLDYDEKILAYVLDPDLMYVSNINEAIYKFNEDVIERKALNLKTNIRQLDLYKLWHFNNKARATSLKKLQIAMRSEDVRDLPYPPGTYLDESVFDDVIEYNIHDCLETEKFYNHPETKEKLKLRKDLSKKYKVLLSNHSDSSIGETVMLKEYCRITNKNEKKVSSLKGEYKDYKLSDIIDYRIKFESKELNNLLNNLKKEKISTFEEIKFIFDDLKLTVAKGGLHSDNDPFYLTNEKYILKDLDAGSYYPHLLLLLEAYPKHLGREFLIVLKELVDRRLIAKSKDDFESKLEAASLKITVNSIYGKLKDEYSFLYDPYSLYKVTINGQLLLLMLAEKLKKLGKIIYANTDGLTYKILPEIEEEFEKITNDFFQSYNIPVEYESFKLMALRDCNNFIFQTISGKIKKKGKLFVTDREFHKDHSMVIVSKAIENYFIHKIPVEKTISECNNIYDFCMMTKFNKSADGYLLHLNYEEKINKNFRYIISKSGPVLLKKYHDGRKEYIWKGYNVEPFNYYHEFNNINYNFYIHQANKIINTIVCQTLTLF